jgi:hypothetical protein
VTTKLQKIWKLTDESTGFQETSFFRSDLEELECSTTIVEHLYLITAEQLRDLITEVRIRDADMGYEFLERLGVEDD